MTLKWNGDAIQKDIKLATVDGCFNTAEIILTDAMKRVPRDTGVLSNSGTITTDEPNPQEIYSKALTGNVGYAQNVSPETESIYISFNTPYAFRQHEELGYNHPNGGEAKYLEKAWNAKIKTLKANITAIAKQRGLM